MVESKGEFSMRIRGFNHIRMTADKLTVQFINPEEKLLHAFERNQAGETRILSV